MRVAIVHELLTMRGGAERVARVFADMFPDAPIFTLMYDEKKLGDWFPAHRVKVLKTQNLKPKTSSRNHHLYLRTFPTIIDQTDLSDYDLIISSSSAFVHGIHVPSHATHICYVHSPAKYLWSDTHGVQERAKEGLLGMLKAAYLSRTFHKLRTWDAQATDPRTFLVAPSKEVARRVQLYWNREATILPPPIESAWFNEEPKTQNLKPKTYFLIVSTLARYKNIDYVIEACNEHSLPLKIVGEGADAARLKKLAGSTIEFLGHKSEGELKELYTHATATIFPGREDFGLVPIESLSCGTPVIAYAKGGAVETISDGTTGTFFSDQTAESISNALIRFDHKKYSVENCRSAAKKYNRSAFEQHLHTIIDQAMSKTEK